MSGLGTRAVLRREFAVYGNARFERLAGLSNGHLYNLRKSRTYRTVRRAWDHTCPSRVMIGERRRPNPRGQPGFVRVDTVHQGDLDGVKGVYHINYKTAIAVACILPNSYSRRLTTNGVVCPRPW